MEIKIKPTRDRGIFTATINSKPAVVAFRRRNRRSEDTLKNSITFSLTQIQRAKEVARKLDAAPFVCAEVMLNDKWQAGFAMPADSFAKYKTSAADFGVSEKYTEQYAKDDAVLCGVRITELEASTPAPIAVKATTTKPAKKGAKA